MENEKSAYLYWATPTRTTKYWIGTLTRKDGKYYFIHSKYASRAANSFWLKIPQFQDLEKVYESDELFRFFKSRLPYSHNSEIPGVLKKYGMEEYDDIELLVRSHGKLRGTINTMMYDRYEISGTLREQDKD
jgi:hypothetical protein